ncbi:hypothetical protein JD969_01595 [Planctomycetota bacterium]|nr:hypothetical protein JD969_01595 [Planctomycetota bacterium]
MRISAFIWGALLTVFFCTSTLSAQTLATTPKQTDDELLASQFVQISNFALAGEGEVRPDQLTRARILMDLALSLTPNDAELWRLRGELSNLEGDQQGYENALRKYLALRPEDDVAQYELILKLVEKQQTLDARTAKIEAILNSKAATRFSQPLRSRLAVYAATSANEMGNTRKALQWLAEASRLDEANPDAAALTYQMIGGMNATMQQTGAALVGMIRAMPYNAQTRLELAELLMSQGVFTRAAEQFRSAAAMSESSLTVDQVKLWSIAMACTGRRDLALKIIDDYEDFLNAQARLQAQQQAFSSGQNLGDATKEQIPAVELPLEILLTQLAIMQGMDPIDLGDRPEKIFAKVKQELLKKAEQGDVIAKEDYLWVGALFNFDTPEINAELRQYPVENVHAQIARGFIALRNNDMDTARAAFEPYKNENPYALYGEALTAPTPTQRYQALQNVVYKGNATTVLLAVEQLQSAKQQVKATSVGDAIRRHMDRYPTRLWNADPANDPWVQLFIESDTPRTNFLDPITINVRLRSKAPLSLAVNTPYTVSGQCMLSNLATILGQATPPSPPQLVDLNRQIRLDENSEIVVEFRYDYTLFGLFAQSNPQNTIIYNVSGVTDPKPTFTGVLAPGIIGQKTTLNSQQVAGNFPTKTLIDTTLTSAASPNNTNHYTALAYLGTVFPTLPADQEYDVTETQDKIGELYNNQFNESDIKGKAWLVRFTPIKRIGEMDYKFQRIIEAAQRSNESMINIMYLATQIADSDDPGLSAAMRSENKDIQAYANAINDAFNFAAEQRAKAEEELKKQQQDRPKGIQW